MQLSARGIIDMHSSASADRTYELRRHRHDYLGAAWL